MNGPDDEQKAAAALERELINPGENP